MRGRAVVLVLGFAACGDDDPGSCAGSTTTGTSTDVGTTTDVEADSAVVETVTCPEATIDGNFAIIECGVGQVAVQRPDYFWEQLWIRVDGGPQEMVEPTCENTSMCPKQERNVCEVHLDADNDTTGSGSTSG